MEILTVEMFSWITGEKKQLPMVTSQRMTLPAWFDHLRGKGFYNKVQFKMFCQPVKTSCSNAENIDKTPGVWLLMKPPSSILPYQGWQKTTVVERLYFVILYLLAAHWDLFVEGFVQMYWHCPYSQSSTAGKRHRHLQRHHLEV